MKILHTSDWHLGKKIFSKDRLEEQKVVMKEIVSIANNEAVDMVIVAGDLFDNYSPSSQAQHLLYSTLHDLSNNGTRPVVCIAGNHDSPERVESPEALADVQAIYLLGTPQSKVATFTTTANISVTAGEEGFMELRLPNVQYPVRVIYTPFANHERLKKFLGVEDQDVQLRNELESRWRLLAEKYCDSNGVNLLVTHLFVTKGADDTTAEPDDENSINVGGASAVYVENFPQEVQYVALGHLHRCFKVGSNKVWYSGSPLEYSFAESEQDKYVLISDIEPGCEAITRKVELTSGCKLVNKEFDSVDEACRWLIDNPDVWVYLTVKTDAYLTANEIAMINRSHSKIVTLRPEVSAAGEESVDQHKISDLIHDTDALFADYFKRQKSGLEPNDDIMNLFHEILAK